MTRLADITIRVDMDPDSGRLIPRIEVDCPLDDQTANAFVVRMLRKIADDLDAS